MGERVWAYSHGVFNKSIVIGFRERQTDRQRERELEQ